MFGIAVSVAVHIKLHGFLQAKVLLDVEFLNGCMRVDHRLVCPCVLARHAMRSIQPASYMSLSEGTLECIA